MLMCWNALDPVPIPGTEGSSYNSAASPSGQEVAFVADGQFKVAPISGGVVRTLADSARCCMLVASVSDQPPGASPAWMVSR